MLSAVYLYLYISGFQSVTNNVFHSADGVSYTGQLWFRGCRFAHFSLNLFCFGFVSLCLCVFIHIFLIVNAGYSRSKK